MKRGASKIKRFLNHLKTSTSLRPTNSSCPVSDLTTPNGALNSYWKHNKWNAYKQSLSLNALSIINGIFPAAIAYQGADMMTSLTNTGLSEDFTYSFGKTLGIISAHSFSRLKATQIADNLSAKVAQHIQTKFASVAQARPDILTTIEKQAQQQQNNDQQASLGHSIFTAPQEFAKAAILKRTGLLNYGVSILALGTALYQNSIPIEILDQVGQQISSLLPGNINLVPGEKGSFVTAIATATAFTAYTTKKGHTLGKKVEATQEKLEVHESNARDNLTKAFSNNSITQDYHTQYQGHIDQSYALAQKQNQASLRLTRFQEITGISNWPYSFIPAVGILWSKDGFQPVQGALASDFWLTQASSLLLLDSLSDAVNALSKRGGMTVPRQHIIGAAQKIEAEWNKPPSTTKPNPPTLP